MTQQNAALVEKSAAAAESLKGQAQQRVQAVAVFKLSGEAARPTARAAAPAARQRRRRHSGSAPTASTATPTSAPAFTYSRLATSR